MTTDLDELFLLFVPVVPVVVDELTMGPIEAPRLDTCDDEVVDEFKFIMDEFLAEYAVDFLSK